MQHDGRTHNAAGSEPPTMAGMAGRAPCVKSRGLARLPQGPHGGEVNSPRDIVCEALSFGWIDSLIKRLDDDRYTLKVTPRQPTSKWPDINRNRWLKLKTAGLLTSAGLAAAPTTNTYAPRPVVPDLPVYIVKALKTNSRAWEFFWGIAPAYRRDFVVWIHTARRPETRARRIRESIALMAAGKKLGLK